MEQATRVAELHVDTLCGIRRLLQEDSVARELEDVDGDAEPLGGEGGVHYGDVLVSQVARN